MSIRFKVILPYLLLTLIVAVTGAYVVTRLVASSLEERLANQLLEAGRVVSDSMARQEIDHVQAARVVAYTRGLGEALRDKDEEQIVLLAKPAAGSLNAESVIVYDDRGAEVLHVIKQTDGSILDVTQRGNKSTILIVDDLLAQNEPNGLPKRILAKDPIDGRYYYFTAIPVAFDIRPPRRFHGKCCRVLRISAAFCGRFATRCKTLVEYSGLRNTCDCIHHQSQGR